MGQPRCAPERASVLPYPKTVEACHAMPWQLAAAARNSPLWLRPADRCVTVGCSHRWWAHLNDLRQYAAMYIYAHAYTHTRAHAHTHTHAHKRTHTRTHAHTRARIHSRANRRHSTRSGAASMPHAAMRPSLLVTAISAIDAHAHTSDSGSGACWRGHAARSRCIGGRGCAESWCR